MKTIISLLILIACTLQGYAQKRIVIQGRNLYMDSAVVLNDSTIRFSKGGSTFDVIIRGGAGGGTTIDTTNKFVNSVTSINDSTIRVFKGATSTDITIKGGVNTPVMDTANHWVNRVYRKTATDSVFVQIGSTASFAFKDSSGSSLPLNYNPFASNHIFFKDLAGVLDPTAPAVAASAITWAFLDSATLGHTFYGFDSAAGIGSQIYVYYPPVKNVISFVITPDETLASAAVQVGASVGMANAIVSPFLLFGNAGKLVGNTTTWTATGLTSTVLTYNTTTGITNFTPTMTLGTIYAGTREIEGTQITYVGTNNYHVRRVYSGLSGQIGFYLIENLTNNIVTGNLSSTDVVVISIPRSTSVAIPAQTVSSNLFPSDIYTSSANYWLRASFELWFRAYPHKTTTNETIWQQYRVGANIATNYRITRATMASPAVETTLFNGFGFSYTDNTAATGVRYIYRMYATVSGVENLITNEKCQTL